MSATDYVAINQNRPLEIQLIQAETILIKIKMKFSFSLTLQLNKIGNREKMEICVMQ